MTPADSNMGRSKIFQALNPRPLWAESEEDKQKKESRKTYISLGQNSRGLSSYVILGIQNAYDTYKSKERQATVQIFVLIHLFRKCEK